MARRGIAIALGAVVITAGGGIAALHATERAPWDPDASYTPVPLLTPTPRELPSWSLADPVLEDVATSDSGEANQIADALDAELGARGLAGQIGAHVVDLGSGEVIYSQSGDAAKTPASLQKILTSTAVLAQLGPDHVFTTRVVGDSDDPARLTLVGGGDPMLVSDDTDGFTSLADLAEATAEEMKNADVSSVTLSYDDTLFEGPGTDPDWEPGYVSEGIVAPVSALSVDDGRISPTSQTRSADPAAAAASTFADLLESHGVDVDGQPSRGASTSDSVDVAAVSSPPLAKIVEYVITTSDNDVAENLGRHVASASGLPASSDDAQSAVTATLADLGVDMSTSDIRDGSGLSRANSVPASTVVAVLTVAASDAYPELRAVLTGLPVAGYTGTLKTRFADTERGVGFVRAKTGTLTQGGVHSLAGVAVSENGAGYAFAIIANDVSPGAAVGVRSALDTLTSTLVAD